MKKIIQLITLILLVSNTCWGQVWYFGKGAGIKFPGPIAQTGSGMMTNEGCAVLNDAAGNILFYTDGSNVYNRNNVTMPNGTGLLGGSSSTQSAIIVPVPGCNCNKYFIFTVASLSGGQTGNQVEEDGLRYSVVDMTLNAGLGDVISTTKNTSLVNTSQTGDLRGYVAEKLTAVKDGNGGFWVLAHGYRKGSTYNVNGRRFYAFHVTNASVGTNCDQPVVPLSTSYCVRTDIGADHGVLPGDALGQMKFSNTGSKIGLALWGSKTLEVFDFNVSTGVVSNPVTLTQFDNATYGVEFSPNEQYVYVTESNGTTSLDLYQLPVGNNATTMWANRNSLSTLSITAGYAYGSLQTGPDKKIYVANCGYSGNFPNTISVINDPDLATASYVHGAIQLPANAYSYLSLPAMIQGFKDCSDPCNKCHNVNFYFNGQRTIKKDTTITIGCNNRNLDFSTNYGCAAPNVVPVLGCTVTDEFGNIQLWASGFVAGNGSGVLNIPNAANPPATYYVDYYFGTAIPGKPKDTCDHIRLTIIDTCFNPPCICPPKPIITLSQRAKQPISKQLDCNTTEEIECGKTYYLRVDPNCQPSGCTDNRYEISISANGGPTQTYVNQGISIQPLVTDQNFTVTIKTYCGGKLCTNCKITFKVKCKCPPPPCCKTKVSTMFNAAASSIRDIGSASLAGLSFNLNGYGGLFTQVRASVISFNLYADDKKCLECYNNSRQWASIVGGNLTGVSGFSRVISGDNNGPNTNTREVTYTSSTTQVINTAQLSMNLMLPPMQTIKCCNVYAIVYIKFTYRDNNCNECEEIIAIRIPLTRQTGEGVDIINGKPGQQGKGNIERINTQGNIRATDTPVFK